MKKTAVILLFVIMLTAILPVKAYAISESDGFGEVWESVDGRTREYLGELGIDEISLQSLFDLTPTRVMKFLAEICFESGASVFKDITLIIVILVISSIASSFLQNSEKTENIIYFTTTLSVISVVIVPVSRILTDAAAGIKTTTVFINGYLPVMTAIIIGAQKPALAFTYNSMTVFLSSLISNFADKFFVPCIGALLSFNVISSFSLENYRDKIIKFVRRMIITVLSLFSTVYTGVITSRSIVAGSSDSIALKGIKFISGTFIPVVGGAVAESVSSVFGSFVIMKNTLGIFVIAVIILINLPVIAELLIWQLALGFCSLVSSMFNLQSVTDTLDNLASVISLLNIIMFFVTFILVISTGVIILMGK